MHRNLGLQNDKFLWMAKKKTIARNLIGMVDKTPAKQQKGSKFKSCWRQF
jgi:hypothetical protein